MAYTASQNTVASTVMVCDSHLTDILPSVLSFHRTVLAACSPAPACGGRVAQLCQMLTAREAGFVAKILQLKGSARAPAAPA